MSAGLNRLTKITFYIIVIAAPIQWVSIFNTGGSEIKYINLSIIPLLLCLLYGEFRRTMIKFFNFCRILIISFIFLMALNYIFTCVNTTNLLTGITYILKNLSYLVYFIAFGPIIIYRYRDKKFYREIAISNILCTLVFLLVVEVTFLALGRNFLSELVTNFLSGNSVAIRYDLFYKLFNNAHFSAGSAAAADADYQTSLRNTLLGAFIYIHFTSLFSLKFCKSFFLKSINVFNLLFSVFLVFASTSRSNMVALVLGYLIYFGLAVYTGTFRFRPIYLFLGMVLLFVFVLLLPKLETVFQGSATMISDRLAQLDDDARWDLDGEALIDFAENPLTGRGAGATLADGHRVHNFILGAAYQTGIAGFFVSCVFYFGIYVLLIKSAKYLARSKGLFWLIALLSLPMLRAMTSGNNGTLSIIEWFCLAFSFAIMLIHKTEYQENYARNRVYQAELKVL